MALYEYLLPAPHRDTCHGKHRLDDNHHFEVTFDYGDTRLTKSLKQNSRSLVLDKVDMIYIPDVLE